MYEEKEMYYITTSIRRADILTAPYVLEETDQRIPYQNGTCLNLPNGMWVVVSHTNYSTFSITGYRRTVWVVPVGNYEPVLNPEDGDDAIIGYYSEFHRGFGGCPDSWERKEVKRNPTVNGDRSLKYLEENNRVRYF